MFTNVSVDTYNDFVVHKIVQIWSECILLHRDTFRSSSTDPPTNGGDSDDNPSGTVASTSLSSLGQCMLVEYKQSIE